jgi:hypothetical protein
MIRLAYISSATQYPSEQDLLNLLTQARGRNLKQNITGMLLYDNATYIQVLEGDAKDVHEIFASIKKDKRNTGVVTLLEETIEQRSFPQWSMGFKTKARFSTTELSGFVDLFNGKLDKTIAIENKSRAVKLLISFAN